MLPRSFISRHVEISGCLVLLFLKPLSVVGSLGDQSRYGTDGVLTCYAIDLIVPEELSGKESMQEKKAVLGSSS